MPEFSPGESKTAIAPITAKPAGMNCEAELFLGPDELTKVASSGRVPFVSTGAAKNVSLPITMPSEGTYHGYIDVFTEGLRFLAYKTKEDIAISRWYPCTYEGYVAPATQAVYSDIGLALAPMIERGEILSEIVARMVGYRGGDTGYWAYATGIVPRGATTWDEMKSLLTPEYLSARDTPESVIEGWKGGLRLTGWCLD